MEISNISPSSMDRQETKKPMRVLDRRPMHQTLKPSGVLGFTSELFGVLLNVFTISLVLMSYFVVRSCYELTRKVNNALWYFPDKVSRCPTFTSYYNKVLVYLEERKRKASENFVYRQVTSNDVDYVVTEEIEVERLQEEFPEQNSGGSRSTTPLIPEAPKVVKAEVHTQEEFPEQNSRGHGSKTPMMPETPEVHLQEFPEHKSGGSGSTSQLKPETPTVVIAEVHTQDTPESSDSESPRSVKFRDQSQAVGEKARRSLAEELDDETEDEDEESSEQETESFQ